MDWILDFFGARYDNGHAVPNSQWNLIPREFNSNEDSLYRIPKYLLVKFSSFILLKTGVISSFSLVSTVFFVSLFIVYYSRKDLFFKIKIIKSNLQNAS